MQNLFEILQAPSVEEVSNLTAKSTI